MVRYRFFGHSRLSQIHENDLLKKLQRDQMCTYINFNTLSILSNSLIQKPRA